MVRQQTRPMPGRETETETCRHHWLIEAPTGPVSVGVCQICEDVREFKNYIEAAPWTEDSTAAQSGARYSEGASPENVEESEES